MLDGEGVMYDSLEIVRVIPWLIGGDVNEDMRACFGDGVEVDCWNRTAVPVTGEFARELAGTDDVEVRRG